MHLRHLRELENTLIEAGQRRGQAKRSFAPRPDPVATAGRPDNRSWLEYLPLLMILSVGVFIRSMLLNQPLRYDEALTFVDYASRPLWYGLSAYDAPNNHLFHTLLVHLVTLGGTQYKEWLIRLPAFFAGLGVIPATYVLGSKLYRREVGLLAAAIVAASAPLVEYSTNARGYSLVTLCFLLLWIVAATLVERPRTLLWLLFALIGAIGFYTIPTMLYGFAVVVVWLALTLLTLPAAGKYHKLASTWHVRRSLCCRHAATLSARVRNVGCRRGYQQHLRRATHVGEFTQKLPQSLAETWSTWNSYMPPVISILLSVGVIASLLLHRRLARFPITPLLAVLICPPIVLIQRVTPYPRVWLFLLPLYALLAVAGWTGVAREFQHLRRFFHFKRISTILAPLLCLLLSANIPIQPSINYLDEAGTEDNAKEIALYIKSLLPAEQKSIEVLPPSETLLFYFRKYGVP